MQVCTAERMKIENCWQHGRESKALQSAHNRETKGRRTKNEERRGTGPEFDRDRHNIILITRGSQTGKSKPTGPWVWIEACVPDCRSPGLVWWPSLKPQNPQRKISPEMESPLFCLPLSLRATLDDADRVVVEAERGRDCRDGTRGNLPEEQASSS